LTKWKFEIECLWRPLNELILHGELSSGTELFAGWRTISTFTTSTRGARLPHTARLILALDPKGNGIALGRCSPNPPGIYRCFLPEWILSLYSMRDLPYNRNA
jgi:hypothetical protein